MHLQISSFKAAAGSQPLQDHCMLQHTTNDKLETHRERLDSSLLREPPRYQAFTPPLLWDDTPMPNNKALLSLSLLRLDQNLSIVTGHGRSLEARGGGSPQVEIPLLALLTST